MADDWTWHNSLSALASTSMADNLADRADVTQYGSPGSSWFKNFGVQILDYEPNATSNIYDVWWSYMQPYTLGGMSATKVVVVGINVDWNQFDGSGTALDRFNHEPEQILSQLAWSPYQNDSTSLSSFDQAGQMASDLNNLLTGLRDEVQGWASGVGSSYSKLQGEAAGVFYSELVGFASQFAQLADMLQATNVYKDLQDNRAKLLGAADALYNAHRAWAGTRYAWPANAIHDAFMNVMNSATVTASINNTYGMGTPNPDITFSISTAAGDPINDQANFFAKIGTAAKDLWTYNVFNMLDNPARPVMAALAASYTSSDVLFKTNISTPSPITPAPTTPSSNSSNNNNTNSSLQNFLNSLGNGSTGNSGGSLGNANSGGSLGNTNSGGSLGNTNSGGSLGTPPSTGIGGNQLFANPLGTGGTGTGSLGTGGVGTGGVGGVGGSLGTGGIGPTGTPGSPLTVPPGSTVNPDGTITGPNGQQVTDPNGNPVTVPPGSKINPNGTITGPNGKQVLTTTSSPLSVPAGSKLNANGTITGPNGQQVLDANGNPVTVPTGSKINSDGTILGPDGQPIMGSSLMRSLNAGTNPGTDPLAAELTSTGRPSTSSTVNDPLLTDNAPLPRVTLSGGATGTPRTGTGVGETATVDSLGNVTTGTSKAFQDNTGLTSEPTSTTDTAGTAALDSAAQESAALTRSSASSNTPFMPPMGGGGGGGAGGQGRQRNVWLAEDEETWGTTPTTPPGVIGR